MITVTPTIGEPPRGRKLHRCHSICSGLEGPLATVNAEGLRCLYFGMTEEEFLDLAGIDVLAASDEHVLDWPGRQIVDGEIRSSAVKCEQVCHAGPSRPS
jgi:hypothetical protein